MEGLKHRALNSAKWNLLEKIINIGFEFAVGIVLARLLIPSDFGTVAIISVVISFSLIFVNSGFGQSLIRDQEVDNMHFSTIFIFNLVIGIIFYLLIFIISDSVATFYKNKDLSLYIKILGFSIIISSFSLIQRVLLTKNLNFKVLSKINIASSLFSGILSLVMAFNGYGIWSLIIKTLSRELVQTIMFWLNNKWKPSLNFDRSILERHFKYGSNFLLSGIITQFYSNILAITIGKIFNFQTLGYYNRAQLFSNIFSDNIGSIMTSVSFPTLSKVQHEKSVFTEGVRMLLKQALYVVGFSVTIIFFASKSMIPLILGEQWSQTGIYLQYFCIAGLFGVLNSILVNAISITGRSRIYLYFHICATLLNVISLLVGYYFQVEAMLISLIVNNFLMYIFTSFVFNSIFGFSLLDQFKDFRKILLVLLVVIIIGVLFSGLNNNLLVKFLEVILQILSIYYISSKIKIEEFQNIKRMLS